MEPMHQNQAFEGFQKPSDPQVINLETMTADELIKLAEENYETMNYDKCNILYEEAIQKHPENDKVLTSYGYFLSNIKDVEKAKEVLTKAIYINPNENPKKYLYIAQLYEGNDSATLYLRAIDILTAQMKNGNQAPNLFFQNTEEVDMNDLKKDLSQAYSAIGELFMTDLALTENAINICKDYLHLAVEVNPTNIDAIYQMINYYLEVDDPEAAEKCAGSLMEVYRQATESNNDDFFDEFPDETYLGIAKVLVEMQKFNDALIIVEDMYEDDSNNMEVLYLLIYCNYMAKNYATCKELLEEFNQKQENFKDEEILTAKQEIEEALRNVNVADGNDWEDVEQGEECISNGEDMDLEQ